MISKPFKFLPPSLIIPDLRAEEDTVPPVSAMLLNERAPESMPTEWDCIFIVFEIINVHSITRKSRQWQILWRRPSTKQAVSSRHSRSYEGEVLPIGKRFVLDLKWNLSFACIFYGRAVNGHSKSSNGNKPSCSARNINHAAQHRASPAQSGRLARNTCVWRRVFANSYEIETVRNSKNIYV